MACGCEGKKYSIGMGCCQPVLGPIENYYTKYQIDEMLDEIESAITSGCCITPEEVDEKIDEATSGLQQSLSAGTGIDITDNIISCTITGSGGCDCDFSDYYTKEQVDAKIPSLSGYATEQWVENKHYITGVDLSDYATEQWVLDKHYISGVDLSDYATKEYVSGYTYDKATIDEKVAGGGTFDPTQYYTTANTYNKTEVNNLLDDKLDASAYTPCDLSNYYTKSETNNQISSATADMATKTWVGQQGYLTEHQSLSGYATQQWVEDKHYITGVDLSNYATKAEIPTVPTNVSAFNNDAGYLTEHQSLSAYSTTQEVTNMINQSVSGKQDTLSAGTGIDITNNVISATGGGAPYSASSGINISNNEISTKIGSGLRYTQDGTLEVNSTNAIASGNTQVPLSYVVYNYVNNNCMLKTQIWCGTQAQYDAITNKDSETLYLIHE